MPRAGWIATLGLVWALALATNVAGRDGCPAFVPVRGKVLIAHAGGGLPDRTYANSITAMDLAYRHGHRLIELDFQEVRGRLFLGHTEANEVTSAAVIDWLRRHPGAFIVTDVKTDNVRGLTKLAAEAGPLKRRFIPQFYHPSEHAAVAGLGMSKPIFTMYRLRAPATAFANSADVRFVTIPLSRMEWAKGLNKPVLVHTVNEPLDAPVAGYYTDCLIPARAGDA